MPSISQGAREDYTPIGNSKRLRARESNGPNRISSIPNIV